MDCQIDLGRTGTNFRRDGFEHMMEDIRRKKINCVVVKDFSRFGRNYIETGNYIEKIFPFMKVRFIAVTDCYDSEYITEDNVRLSMHLKNIVNELYAKDIAQRVRTAKRVKRELGSYTGGSVPYGYRAEKVGDRNVLFPDTNVKDIVVRIFEKYAEGCSRKEIIEELYRKRVQRPSVYQRTREVYCPEDEILQQWSADTIKRMLTNPVYIGTLFKAGVCGKGSEECGCHEIQNADTKAAEYTHEPVVLEDLFYKVSQRFEKQRKYSNKADFSEKLPQNEDPLKDIIYCGGCGRRLVRNSQVKTFADGDKVRNYYYICPNRNRIDDGACKCPGISFKALDKILKSVLEKEFVFSEMYLEDYCRENLQEMEGRRDVIRKKRCESEQKQEKLILTGSRLYLRYRGEELSRQSFLEEKAKTDRELELLKKQVEDWEKREEVIDREAKKTNQLFCALMKHGGDYTFDKKFVECLIKQINVGPKQQVEIIWNYGRNDLFYGR